MLLIKAIASFSPGGKHGKHKVFDVKRVGTLT